MREFCTGRETSDVTCHGGKNGTYCRIWRLQFFGFCGRKRERKKKYRKSGEIWIEIYNSWWSGMSRDIEIKEWACQWLIQRNQCSVKVRREKKKRYVSIYYHLPDK